MLAANSSRQSNIIHIDLIRVQALLWKREHSSDDSYSINMCSRSCVALGPLVEKIQQQQRLLSSSLRQLLSPPLPRLLQFLVKTLWSGFLNFSAQLCPFLLRVRSSVPSLASGRSAGFFFFTEGEEAPLSSLFDPGRPSSSLCPLLPLFVFSYIDLPGS